VLDIRSDRDTGRERVLALPVIADGDAACLLPTGIELAEPLSTEIGTFLADVDHDGAAGVVHALPRHFRDPLARGVAVPSSMASTGARRS